MRNPVSQYYSSAQHHWERDPLVRVESCENYGYSMGQWLKIYETHRDEFDYYLFMEVSAMIRTRGLLPLEIRTMTRTRDCYLFMETTASLPGPLHRAMHLLSTHHRRLPR